MCYNKTVCCLIILTSFCHSRGGSRIFFLRGGALVSCSSYFNTNKPHSLFFGRIPVVLENRTPCTLPLDPPLHSNTFKNKNFDFKSFYSAFRLLFIVPVWSCIGWSVKQVAKVMEKSQKYWFSVFCSRWTQKPDCIKQSK